MKQHNLFKSLLAKIHPLLLITLLGTCWACTNEENLEAVTKENNVEIQKYDSTYNAAFNLYVVSDDTTSYNIQSYSAPFNAVEKSISSSLNEYAAKMLSEYSDTNKENTILSPLSATMLYSLMANFSDAKKSSNVYKDNMGLAHVKTDDMNSYFRKLINKKKEETVSSDNNNGLSLASNLWVEEKKAVYKSFLSTTGFYEVKVKGMDMDKSSTLSYINETIKNQMGDDYNAIKQSALNNAKPLITSSMAFKNEWKESFKVDSSLTNEFSNIDGSKTVCKTLCATSPSRYGHFDKFDMMEIPYKDESYSMFVVIPHTVDGLSQSLSSLYKQGLAHCMENVSDTTRTFQSECLIKRDTVVYEQTYEVVDTLITDTIFDIRLPKVKLCSSTPLNQQNTSVSSNTKQMFQTNLPKVSPNGFTLGNVYQSCSFELDEKSTTAESDAGIEIDHRPYTTETSIVVIQTGSTSGKDGNGNHGIFSIPKGKKIHKTVVVPFHATHPFAIFIRDNKLGAIPFASSIKTLANQ